MPAHIQSVVALVVVLLAAGYLGFNWWRNRRRTTAGCRSPGTCGCPAPKPSLKSKR